MKTTLSDKYKFVFLLAISLFFLSFQTEKDVLVWSENRSLTWDDFKGKPEKRFAAASTHYDLLKSISKENSGATVKIEAVFFTNASWKKVSWINDEVLAHEQKHFDIVELYARKLRKALSEQKFKTYSDLENTLDKLYDKFDKEMDLYQDKYDEETDGSMNGDQQRAWQKKISNQIEELGNFKETSLKILF